MASAQREEFPIRDALIIAIAGRLRSVCAHWPESKFSEMVERIADITLRYQGRDTGGVYNPSATEALLDELKVSLARSEAHKHPPGADVS